MRCQCPKGLGKCLKMCTSGWGNAMERRSRVRVVSRAFRLGVTDAEGQADLLGDGISTEGDQRD